MTNREKYDEEFLNFACSSYSIAVSKKNGRLEKCEEYDCYDCAFYEGNINCYTKRKEWANAEYVETPKISKRDRAFLEYIKAPCKYIARDMKGDIYAYKGKPTKTIDVWNLGGVPMYVSWLEVDFPMVKWEDEEPWLIEDLKKLEVVEEYESN